MNGPGAPQAGRVSEILHAAQLSDSGLPIGRFAHSNGAEAWLSANPQATEAGLDRFVRAAVTEGVAPLDGVATAAAHAGGSLGDLLRIDGELDARKLAPAARAASRSCGRSMLALARSLTDDPILSELDLAAREGRTTANLPVVEGRLARSLGLGQDTAVALSLRGSAAAMLSAAVRLGRLAPSRAQALLMAMSPAIERATATALETDWREAHSSAPAADVALLAHESASGRLFAS